MAGGIGEASAIITIAQLGLTLASTLSSFIGDYKEAGNRMNHLSDEIQVASSSLRQIGDLAKQSRLYGERGVLQAANLTERCRIVIFEIRTILKKGDKTLDPTAIDKTEIDLSCYRRLKWAMYLKSRLEIPRLELARLKSDLMLVYLSMIAIGGQNKAERDQASAEILGLKRTLDWANKRYNDAVQRRGVGTYVEPPPLYSAPPTVVGRDSSRQGGAIRDEDDAENLQRFVEFKEKQLAEEKARREREALELRRLEEQRQKEEEEKRNREIAEKAIAEYEIRKQREADEENDRRLQLQTDFRRYLEDAALPEEEIDRIMNGVPAPSNAVVPYDRPASIPNGVVRSPPDHPVALAGTLQSVQQQRSARQSTALAMENDEASSSKSSKVEASQKRRRSPREPAKLVAWSVDQRNQHRFRLPISQAWLTEFLTRQQSSKEMWRLYSKLHPWYKKEIDEVFDYMRRHERKYAWSLIFLKKIKQRKGPGFLSNGHFSLQLVLTGVKRRCPVDTNLEYGVGDDYPKSPDPRLEGDSDDGESVATSDEHDAYAGGQTPRQRKKFPRPTGRGQSVTNRTTETASATRKVDDGSNAPNDEDDVVEVIEADEGPYPRNRSTLPKRLVTAEALWESGYAFHEEGERVIVHQALSSQQIDGVLKLSNEKTDSIAIKSDKPTILTRSQSRAYPPADPAGDSEYAAADEPSSSRTVTFAPETSKSPGRALTSSRSRGDDYYDHDGRDSRDWQLARRGDMSVVRYHDGDVYDRDYRSRSNVIRPHIPYETDRGYETALVPGRTGIEPQAIRRTPRSHDLRRESEREDTLRRSSPVRRESVIYRDDRTSSMSGRQREQRYERDDNAYDDYFEREEVRYRDPDPGLSVGRGELIRAQNDRPSYRTREREREYVPDRQEIAIRRREPSPVVRIERERERVPDWEDVVTREAPLPRTRTFEMEPYQETRIIRREEVLPQKAPPPTVIRGSYDEDVVLDRPELTKENLYDARDALERSRKRRDNAERAGDLRTASDLTYHTIPKAMRLVENIEKADANRHGDVASRDMLLNELDEGKAELERLRTRLYEAERSRDFAMASDLKCYAIPDVEGRVQEMEEKLARLQTGTKATDDSDDDSSMAETHVHQPSFVPEGRPGPRRHSLPTESSPSRSENGATGQTDAEALAEHLAQYTHGNTATSKDNTAAADTPPLQALIRDEEVHDEPEACATGSGEAKSAQVEDQIEVVD